MISIDWVLNLAITTIKQQLPESIYSGFLVNKGRVFNAEQNETVDNITNSPVEIILDKLTHEEIQASGLLSTDLKFYIIGDKLYDVSFYQHVLYNGREYKIKQLVESLVGSKTALWTIVCQK